MQQIFSPQENQGHDFRPVTGPDPTVKALQAGHLRRGKVSTKPFALLTIQRTAVGSAPPKGYGISHSDESAEAWLAAWFTFCAATHHVFGPHHLANQ